MRQLQQRLQRTTALQIQQKRLHLQSLKARLRHPGQGLREQAQRLDHLELRLLQAWQRRLQSRQDRLNQLQTRLKYRSPDQLRRQLQEKLHTLNRQLTRQSELLLVQKKQQLALAAARLHSISPLATLERGYAIVTDDQGHVLTTATDVQAGQQVATRLHQGTLLCTVNTTQAD